MKTLLSVLFILVFGNIFSQNNNEIKVSLEKFQKAINIQDVIKSIPEGYDIIGGSYSAKVSGKSGQGVINENKIPESLKKHAYKGETVYFDLKSKEKSTGKIMANSVKVIIE